MIHIYDHSHIQSEERNYRKIFTIGIGLNVGFVSIEIMNGLMANSSALLADAGHNTSDVLAWTATRLATMKPKGKYIQVLKVKDGRIVLLRDYFSMDVLKNILNK